MHIQTLAELIEALGGADATARVLSERAGRKIGAKAVYKWCDRGALPPRWILPALAELEARGLHVSVKTLGQLAQPIAQSEAA